MKSADLAYFGARAQLKQLATLWAFGTGSMTSNVDSTLTAVHRLKQEIDKLTEEQTEALKSATYLGMTADEAKEYDARRENIMRLVEQLALLEKAQ